MDEITRELSIPLDSEGYFVFQCPNCAERFKLLPNEFQSDDVDGIYCPYCGLQASVTDCYPPEVIERAMIAAQNVAMGLISDMFNNLERSSKGLIKVTGKIKEEPDTNQYQKGIMSWR